MIRPIDWPMFGLKAAQLGLNSRPHPVPTGGAAQPFREMGELFPRWAAEVREPLTIGLHGTVHNHFNQERHLISRDLYGERRSAVLAEWRAVSG